MDKLAYGIPEAVQVAPVGKTRLYEAINGGVLKAHTRARRAFEAVKHHPAVATAATLALVVGVVVSQNTGTLKGVMAGMIGCVL